MLYNIHYDVAAFFILLIVISVFALRKKIPDSKNSLFIAICFDTVFSAAMDLLSGVCASYQMAIPHPLHWIVNMVYFIIMNLLPVLFFLYCLSLSDQFTNIKKNKLSYLYLLPYAASVVLILLTPAFHFTFSISETNVYSRQNGMVFLYLSSFFYISLGVFFLLKYNKFIENRKKFAAYSFIIISIISILLQLFFPRLLIQNFGLSLSLLLIFLSLQTTEQILDGITSLFNQKAFDIMSTRLFKSKKEFYTIGIVLDDLTFLNNTFGLDCINNIQYDIGIFLQQSSGTNRVYRLFEGAFCIILPSFNIDESEKLIEVIKSGFVHSWKHKLLDVKLSTKLCLIACPQDADSAASIIDIISTVATDNRYKQEKLIYARNIDTYDLKRVAYIEQQLKTAIQDGRISVYYQPLFSIKEQRIIGAEALVRLKDKEGKFISPEEFVPISEKDGSILRIGLFVFDHVCRFMSSTKIEKYGVNMIDINLSVAQCMQNSLSNQLIEIMKIYNLSPKCINLEITETAAAHTPEMLRINMAKLSKFGFEFSLDDYGSGYANINYLLHLPFSMIKIDKDIIWTAFKDQDPRAFAIMTGIIDMMKNLNMKIVAEGIDSKEMVDKLNELQCDFLQGYYYSEPLPEQGFFTLIQESAPVSITNKQIISTLPIDGKLGNDLDNLDDIEELEEVEELEEI